MAERMPALFVGHGNPMNALLNNPYTQNWAALGDVIPKPKAILCVSAHWYIEDAAVTVSTAPKTIHDFSRFPPKLYDVQYPAPGDPDLAARTQKLLAPLPVRHDERSVRVLWSCHVIDAPEDVRQSNASFQQERVRYLPITRAR